MNCYVCDANENWKSLAGLSTEGEILVCKTCGNACYRVDDQNEEVMREFYRKEYRQAPTHMNLLTTTNKLGYVKAFLADFLAERSPKKTGKRMIVGDVGCATGYLPNFFRELGHRATGSEYTRTFRRFAEHFYKIPVTEELEPKHKYDLITIYHVLEHMVRPDQKLIQYAGMLADDGYMMVSTPEWLDTLEESSGSSMQSFEHLFPKPHINIFTAQSLKNLFAKAGLIIVKEDHLQYGQTYLLKKGDPAATKDSVVFEPWEKIVEKLVKTKEAINLYRQNKWEEAVKVWPKFPESWLALIGNKHGKSPDAQADLFEKIRPILGDNSRVLSSLAVWLYQQNRYEDSYNVWMQLHRIKPNADGLVFMGYCMANMGNHAQAMECFHAAAAINPLKWVECMDWICKEACEMPTWDEKLEADVKERLWNQAKKNLDARPVDPLIYPEQSKGPVAHQEPPKEEASEPAPAA